MGECVKVTIPHIIYRQLSPSFLVQKEKKEIARRDLHTLSQYAVTDVKDGDHSDEKQCPKHAGLFVFPFLG